MNRVLRHLLATRWSLRRTFPPGSLAAIETAIRAAERDHSGEIRFAVESGLHLRELLAGTGARARAIDAFARLGVWNTVRNNGVLIYLLLADRDIEIVADRGFAGKVGEEEWQDVSRCMENEFRAGHFEAGALAGIRRASAIIARHYPPVPDDRDELPNAPELIE
jgi:uncharacterized membrane protein